MKRWGSTSHTTVVTGTAFSTPNMGVFNSTRMKWVYHTLNQKKDVAFIQNIWGHFEGFTKKEISAAKLASETQGMIYCPSKIDFKSMVRNNMIQN